LFASERKQSEEWDTSINAHPVGTTERKWDRQMATEIGERRKALLKKQRERTDISSEISAADVLDHTANKRIKSLKTMRRASCL
jgi:hypothetical protein